LAVVLIANIQILTSTYQHSVFSLIIALGSIGVFVAVTFLFGMLDVWVLVGLGEMMFRTPGTYLTLGFVCFLFILSDMVARRVDTFYEEKQHALHNNRLPEFASSRGSLYEALIPERPSEGLKRRYTGYAYSQEDFGPSRSEAGTRIN